MNKKELICYNSDASRLIGKAEKVVFPKTLEEVQNIVKNSENIVPRGSGSNKIGGCVPYNSTVVDMSKMNKILSFNPKNNTVEVEAGISIKELNEKLNSIDFELPIICLNEASTIGGLVAINASNPRSMKYGKTKDWIEEIEFVNGRGELMKIGKADLGDVCGMEGITGIIVKLKLKVSKKIKKSASIFQSDNLDEVLSIARRLRLEGDVVMLELFSKQVSEMIDLPKKYNLVIEFDSDRGKIKNEEYEKVLKLRKEANYNLLAREYYNSEDSKFFFDKLKDFLLYLESSEIPYFGYLGEGVVYSFFTDEEEDKRFQLIDLMRKFGGKFVSGIGIKRKDYVDDFEKKIIQRVKLRHDPFGKLNKGKIIDFEARISVGRHLKPLQEDEIEEIKPIVGERITADKVEKEIERKSPEEKIQEFIEKVELVEKTGEEKEKIKEDEKEIKEERGEIEKEDLREDAFKKEDPYSAQKLLQEYEYTYDSELPEKRAIRIEEFAKNVPKEIEKKEEQRKGKLTKEEEDVVKKVMLGEKEEENQYDNYKKR